MKQWLVLSLIALAGCTSSGDTQSEEPEEKLPIEDQSTQSLRDLAMGEGIPAPEWNIGDQFGHHFRFAEDYRIYFNDDGDGIHTDVIVTNVTESSYVLDTTDTFYARLDAAYDMPIVGEVSKENLGASAYSGSWLSYPFPLRDGQTWTQDITLPFWNSEAVTFNATWNDAIETRTYGFLPGFEITGMMDDTIVIETDYMPTLGWYGSMRVVAPFDDFTTEFYTVDSMGNDSNWTGQVTRYDAKVAVELTHALYAFDASNVAVQPAVPREFAVADSDTHLFGLLLAGAAAGTTHDYVVMPNGDRIEFSVEESSADDVTFDIQFVDIEGPQTGNWNAAILGAGAFSYGQIELLTMVEEVLDVGAMGAPLP